MQKKAVCILLALFILFVPTAPLLAQEFSLQSGAVLLMDVGSRQILYEQNAHEKFYPASITKIMTMLLAMEQLEAGRVKLTDMVPVSEYAASMGGSQIFLSPGDKVSFEELMIGIGVGSANDGAVAMAEYLAGSAEAFVKMMNEKAAALGMKNTNFVNPHGLHDENHYTTAYDVALMSLELLRYPKIHKWVTIWMDEEFLKGKIKKREGVYLSNSNRLVRYYEGADGLKTGYTGEAGNCISATAKRGDTRLLAVIMKAPGRTILFDEARALLDYGFANFTSVPVVKKGEVLATVPVDKGKFATVELVAAQDLVLLLKKGQPRDFRRELDFPKKALAPLRAGEGAGTLAVKGNDGTELGRVELVPARDVPRAGFLDFLRRFTYRWLYFGR